MTERRSAIPARIFVGNLHYDTTREELHAALSAAGTIVDLHLPTSRETGRPRGFAFVAFSSDEEAAEAIRRFNQLEVRGRKLNLQPADDRPRHAEGARFRSSPLPFDPAGFGGGGGGFGGGGLGAGRRAPNRRAKGKGSRRGLRGRKRSL